eukprot:4181339-Pleurochrysis_carterae.AAC.2
MRDDRSIISLLGPTQSVERAFLSSRRAQMIHSPWQTFRQLAPVQRLSSPSGAVQVPASAWTRRVGTQTRRVGTQTH